jgi:hypothetical protein
MVSSKDIQKARRMALRKRAASACEACKTAKSKCNDFRPCSRCIRNDDESCATHVSSEKRGAQATGSLGPLHVISGSSDSGFSVGAFLPLEEVREHTNPFNPIKRQRISNLVAPPSFMVDHRFIHPLSGLPLTRTSMPPLVDMGLGTTILATSGMQPAAVNCFNRPFEQCVYPPSPWSATTSTPPSTLPRLLSSSTFAGCSNMLSSPFSAEFGLAGNSPASSVTDLTRMQYQLRLAGMLHDYGP